MDSEYATRRVPCRDHRQLVFKAVVCYFMAFVKSAFQRLTESTPCCIVEKLQMGD
jgi:hypothetical protein